jgi:hypothetical protein
MNVTTTECQGQPVFFVAMFDAAQVASAGAAVPGNIGGGSGGSNTWNGASQGHPGKAGSKPISKKPESGLSTAAIIGIAIGAAVLIIIIIALAVGLSGKSSTPPTIPTTTTDTTLTTNGGK